MSVLSFLKDKYKVNKRNLSTGIDSIRRQGLSLAVKQGANEYFKPAPQMRTRDVIREGFKGAYDYNRGLGHGILKTLNQTSNAQNRLSNTKARYVNPNLMVNYLANKYTLNQRNSQSKAGLQTLNKFEQRIAPTTTSGKVGSFVGENLPYAAIPNTPVFGAAKYANRPVMKILTSGAQRGIEMAGINAATKYGEGRDVKQIAKEAPADIAAGAALNTVLSPRVAYDAYKSTLGKKTPGVFSSMGARPGAASKPMSDTDFEVTKTKQYLSNLIDQEAKAQRDLERSFTVDTIKTDDGYSRITGHSSAYRDYYKQHGKEPTLNWWRDKAKRELESGQGQLGQEYQSVNDYFKEIAPKKIVIRTQPKAAPQVVDVTDNMKLTSKQKNRVFSEAEPFRGDEFSREKPYRTQSDDPYALFKSEKQMIDQSMKTAKTPVNERVNWIDSARTPDRVFKKFGMEEDFKNIRKANEAYQKELPKEIDKVSNWAKQTTKQENLNIFRYLDGQNVKLNPNEQRIANEVKEYLDGWADRLDLPQDKRITSYITHIFEKGETGAEFPEDIAKIIHNRPAGSVYDPFVMERLGKQGYVEDTWRALDAYVKRATRKANLDPALKGLPEKAKNLEVSQQQYVKEFIDNLNMRPSNLDTRVDNFIKTIVGQRLGDRPVATLTRPVRQMIYRATLGLNFSTAFKNLSQGANTYAVLGEKNTIGGYIDLARNAKSNKLKELYDVGVLDDSFIQDRTLSATKKFWEKTDKALFYFFETAEKINRGAAYFGAKRQAIQKGLQGQAVIDHAKQVVRDTQFTFGVDSPVMFQSDVGKTALQFQSFTTKQAEFLIEQAIKKNYAGLFRWLGATLAFVYGSGDLVGMDYLDIIPSVRIGGMYTQAYEAGKKAITGKGEYGEDLNGWRRYQPLANSAGLAIPGFTQARKTYQGLTAVNKGYVPTASDNVAIPVDKTAKNYATGAVFGKNALPGVRDYYKGDNKALSDKQSEVFKAKQGFKSGGGRDYYNQVIQQRKTDKLVDEEKDAIKDNKDNKPRELSDGLYLLSNDKVYAEDLNKSFDTSEDAKLAVQKDAFKNSSDQFRVIQGKKYYKAKDGTIRELKTKIKVVKSTKKARKKTSKKFKTIRLVATKSSTRANLPTFKSSLGYINTQSKAGLQKKTGAQNRSKLRVLKIKKMFG